MDIEKTKRTLEAEKINKKIVVMFESYRKEYPDVARTRICETIAKKIGRSTGHVMRATRLNNLK